MALSNWATLSFNNKGEVSESRFIIEKKLKVEMKKNYLMIGERKDEWIVYLREQSAGFNFLLHGINIEVYYHKPTDNSCFFIVTKWDKRKKDTVICCGGIGTYAFDDNDNEVGVTEDVFKDYIKWVKKTLFKYSWDKENKSLTGWIDTVKKVSPKKQYNQGDLYFKKHGLDFNPLRMMSK